MLPAGHQYFSADSVKFHYLVRGSGPLVVLCSVGWGVSGSYMWDTMTELDERNQVLYLEPRGNGESSRPDDDSTMSAKTMAEDLEHLRKHLNLESMTLIGSSHAGAITLRYAEVYPERVDRLILISAQIMDRPANTNTQDWIEKRKDIPGYQGSIAQLQKFNSGQLPQTDAEFGEALAALSPWYFSDPSKGSLLTSAMGDAKPSIWAFRTNINDTLPENKIEHIADAGKVKARVLIIQGEEDAMCSVAGLSDIAAACSQCDLYIIPEVGHCIWLEDPRHFWPKVHEFLDKN